MGKALRLAGVVLVMLLAAAIPAGADTEIKLTTTLTGLNPVTGEVTGDPDGTGKAEFTFDTEQGTVCYEIEVEGIAAPVEPGPGVGSAHIHFLATGGIAVNLQADFQPDKSDEFKASGCVQVDSALLQAILENPDQFYVNIHNAEFPGGALAGLLSG
jgi:hypothetical protein